MNANSNNNILRIIQFPVVQCRWLLMVFFLGLIVAQGIYCATYLKTIYELLHHVHFWEMKTEQVMMCVLELVDMVLIALLIYMVIVGSYENAIGRLNFGNHSEHEFMSSGSLKIKMASSLVMVSAINLLQPFLEPEVHWNDIAKKCIIHLVFLTSAFGLSYIEYLHEKCHALERCKLPEESIIKMLENL